MATNRFPEITDFDPRHDALMLANRIERNRTPGVDPREDVGNMIEADQVRRNIEQRVLGGCWR